ncbi:MAG: hypothetical protein BWY82_02032 [Verrucomicrobia bacterium ADurb.Bin474]|nr:MAG: hypothetical protein BWY82_02032 [Verrucomicrobia bacterium ADurb.Bin474]
MFIGRPGGLNLFTYRPSDLRRKAHPDGTGKHVVIGIFKRHPAVEHIRHVPFPRITGCFDGHWCSTGYIPFRESSRFTLRQNIDAAHTCKVELKHPFVGRVRTTIRPPLQERGHRLITS